jgi:hypothetical protein
VVLICNGALPDAISTSTFELVVSTALLPVISLALSAMLPLEVLTSKSPVKSEI